MDFNGERLIVDFQNLMRCDERCTQAAGNNKGDPNTTDRQGGFLPVALFVLLIALLPLFAVGLGGWLSGVPVEPPAAAAPAADDAARIEALETALSGARDWFTETADRAPAYGAIREEALQAVRKAGEELAAMLPRGATATEQAIRESRSFRARALFAGGVLLVGTFALLMLIAQYQLVQRHWLSLYSDVELARYYRSTRNAPGIPGVFVRIAVMAAAIWLALVWDVSTLLRAAIVILPALALFHWQFNPRREPIPAGMLTPATYIALTALAIFAVSLWLTTRFDLPGPLEARLATDRWGGFRIPLAGLTTLILSVFATTAFGVVMLARTYPDVTDVERFVQAIDGTNRETAAKHSGEMWKAMKTHIVQTFSDRKITPPAATGAPAQKPEAFERLTKEQRRDLRQMFDPLRVNSTLSAQHCISLIETLVIPVAVLMVLTLVLAILGLNVLETLHGEADETAAEALDGATEGFVLLLGAAFSVSLGLIYIPWVARLAPAAVSAADEDIQPPAKDKPRRVWSGTWASQGSPYSKAFTVEKRDKSAIDKETADKAKTEDAIKAETEAAKAKKDADALVEHVLGRHVGAQKSKFQAIIASAPYGGGFQGAVRGKPIELATKIGALLAPVGASAILALLS